MKKNIKPRTKEYTVGSTGQQANFKSITSLSIETAVNTYIQENKPEIFKKGINSIVIELAANRKNYIAAVVSGRYKINFFIIY